MTDNELIAEFMGGVFYGPDDSDHPNKWWFQNQPHEGYRKDAHHISDFLRYDKDWSWLMPVVQKIETIYSKAFPPGEEFIRRILAHEEPIEEQYVNVLSLPMSTPINEVYEAVVEFIKWHNGNR